MPAQGQYATYPSLFGRIVVISGGATGIGASMVEAFATQGAKVVILDILSEAASELIQKLRDRNVVHPPVYHQCDVTKIDDELKPVAAKILESSPSIDVLVNNAANDVRQPTLEVTQEQWDQGIAVNLRHVFFLTQALMPGLLTGGSASVINMGSISWEVAVPSLITYVSSKSGIVGLTKALAEEFGPKGIRVNSIMPGAIATEKQKREIYTPEIEADILKGQAVKRMLQPDDVARMALWLAADDSSAVTSQSIRVDAGWI
ncbi:NAD(P)-binding protein [Rhizodiscina lignyota]|uniref:NAD(P)-binding protein n=1 Tax=Rhizodiscina lignyota TaxID=1504668 RepID=A0A9P4IBW3_9PEZI|nr:NAD(P)-binding protein [Rhizodiscina lignyota]